MKDNYVTIDEAVAFKKEAEAAMMEALTKLVNQTGIKAIECSIVSFQDNDMCLIETNIKFIL